MRKKLFLIVGISFILFAGCKQLLADIEKDLDYWLSSVHIVDTILPPFVEDVDGYPCVPSNDDTIVTLKLVNPQNYILKTPGDSGAPSDMVVFESGVEGSGGAVPVHGIDYEFQQTGPNEVKFVYKKAFLEKSEWGGQNLSASITLYNREGRKFGTHSFKLRANSRLPEPKGIALLKTKNPDTSGKYYYVLCFRPKGIEKKINNNTELLHKDLSEIYIKKGNESAVSYPLKFNGSNTGFDISGVLISLNDTQQLSSSEIPAGGAIDPIPLSPWVICLKTDIPVVSDSPQTTYNVWLKDEKGIFSLPGTKTTNKFKLPDPKISFSDGMDNVLDAGVYTPVGQPADSTALLNGTHAGQPDGSSEEKAIPIYSAYGNDIQLKIKVNIHDPTVAAGLEIKTYVYRKTESGFQLFSDSTALGGSETFVELSAKSEEVIYRFETSGFLSGFEDSDVFSKYYKVIKGVNGNTSGGVPVWGILKKAVEKTGSGGTLIVRGEVKATNSSGGAGNHGEIEIKKDITIRGKTGKDVDSINANSSALGSNLHRIFNINAKGKNVRLEGLTIKNGKESNADGGAVLHKSGNLHIKDCKFENNEVTGTGKGGAVYYEDGTLTLSGSAELPSTGEGKNDIYIEKSEKFISIASPLTTENVARITPKDYTIVGSPRKVLGAVASVNLASQVSKFTVSPQTTGGGSQKWIIDDRGFLQKILTGDSSTDNWNTLVTALNSAQNGQILYLDGEYEMSNASNTIIISKSCTIRGMDGTVLNVNKTGTMFLVQSPDSLFTIENLEIKNGKDDTYVLTADIEGSFKLKNVRVNGVKKLVSSDSGDISLEGVTIQGESSALVIELGGREVSNPGDTSYSYLNLKGNINIQGKIKLIFPAGEDNYKGCIKVCDNKAYALRLGFGSDYTNAEGKQVVFVDPNAGISVADAVANISVEDDGGLQWYIDSEGKLKKRD